MFKKQTLALLALLVVSAHQPMPRTIVPSHGLSFRQSLGEAGRRLCCTGLGSRGFRFWAPVVATNPTSIDFCYRLGNSHYESGASPKALAAFERCDLLTGGRSYWEAFNLAKTYARLGDEGLAMEWAQKAFDRGLPERGSFQGSSVRYLALPD